MGAAEVIADSQKSSANEAILPAMDAERFEANLAKYGPAIRDGRATAEQIITGLQEKATLSAEQIQRLKDCAPVIIEGEAA